jgi:hypothetical protein
MLLGSRPTTKLSLAGLRSPWEVYLSVKHSIGSVIIVIGEFKKEKPCLQN